MKHRITAIIILLASAALFTGCLTLKELTPEEIDQISQCSQTAEVIV